MKTWQATIVGALCIAACATHAAAAAPLFRITDIGLQARGTVTVVNDMNDHGVIVGEATTSFIWTAETGMQDIPWNANGVSFTPYSINNAGDMVGSAPMPVVGSSATARSTASSIGTAAERGPAPRVNAPASASTQT